MICLETTFLVDYLNENPENLGPAGRYLDGNETQPFATSAVSLYETLYGVAVVAANKSQTPTSAVDDRRTALDFIDVLPFNADIAIEAIEIRVELRAAGNEIPMNDTYIAATARYHGYPLVCADERFEAVSGLDTVRYK